MWREVREVRGAGFGVRCVAPGARGARRAVSGLKREARRRLCVGLCGVRGGHVGRWLRASQLCEPASFVDGALVFPTVP